MSEGVVVMFTLSLSMFVYLNRNRVQEARWHCSPSEYPDLAQPPPDILSMFNRLEQLRMTRASPPTHTQAHSELKVMVNKAHHDEL
jgi:hypothetical protein